MRRGSRTTQPGFVHTHRVHELKARYSRSLRTSAPACVGRRAPGAPRSAREGARKIASSSLARALHCRLEDERSIGASLVPDPSGERCALVRDGIRAHLTRFPNAGDTQQGILANWLAEIRRDDAVAVIQDVLASMLSDGELVRSVLPGGGVFYARGPDFTES